MGGAGNLGADEGMEKRFIEVAPHGESALVLTEEETH